MAEYKLEKLDFFINNFFEWIKNKKTNRLFTKSQNMEIYTISFDILSNSQRNPLLFLKMKNLIFSKFENFLNKYLEFCTNKIKKNNYELSIFNKIILDFNIIYKWFSVIFQYLDRTYVKCPKNEKFPKNTKYIYEMFICEYFVKKFKTDIVQKIIEEIFKFRNNDISHIETVRPIMKFCFDCKIDELNVCLLKSTEEFYNFKKKELIELPFKKYIDNVILFEKIEKNILSVVFQYSSCDMKNAFTNKFYKIILMNDYKSILGINNNKRFYNVVKMNMEIVIKNTYNLYCRIDDGIKVLCIVIDKYFNNCYKTLGNITEKNYISVFDNLIGLNNRISNLIKTCFDQNKIIEKFFYNCVEYVINHNDINYSLFNSFIDDKFSKHCENEFVDEIFEIFKFIHQKDLFISCYKISLSDRLLNNKATIRTEKYFIEKIKLSCGIVFTQNLEMMINDYFKPHIDFKRKINFKILNKSVWPKLPDFNCRTNSYFSEEFDRLKNLYKSKNSKKKLKLNSVYGIVQLKMKLGNKTYFIETDFIQSQILLLFNDPKIGYFLKELKNKISVPKNILINILKYFNNLKLLNLKKIDGKTKFFLNNKFISEFEKIKLKSTKIIKCKNVKKKIDVSRDNSIQATIVRIMKLKKSMNFEILIGETIKQQLCYFKPNISNIKKNIKKLIIRNYIKRDEKDSKKMLYCV